MTIPGLHPRFTHEEPTLVETIETPELSASVVENSRYRWLEFGNRVVQSAMRMKRPAELVLPYSQSMLAPLLFRAEPPRNILLLGLGGGSLVRYLRHFVPGAKLTAVELSASVADLCERHFMVGDDTHALDLVLEDAREFLASCSTRFDLILVDIFDETGMPKWLMREPFLMQCRHALAPGGGICFNTMPDGESELRVFLTEMRSAFVGHVLCTTLVDYRNVMLLGFGHQPEPSDVRSLTRRANQLERLYAVPLYRLARNLIATNAVRGERLVV